MKIYIGTKLENHTAHRAVHRIINSMGHELTYDWTLHGPVWTEGLPRIREIARAEAEGVKAADLCVILWPGGRGTHVELGIALGAGVPVILLSEVPGHHAAAPETCAFYHHPGVIARVWGFLELRDQIRKLDMMRNRPCDHSAGFYQFEGDVFCEKCHVNEDLIPKPTK